MLRWALLIHFEKREKHPKAPPRWGKHVVQYESPISTHSGQSWIISRCTRGRHFQALEQNNLYFCQRNLLLDRVGLFLPLFYSGHWTACPEIYAQSLLTHFSGDLNYNKIKIWQKVVRTCPSHITWNPRSQNTSMGIWRRQSVMKSIPTWDKGHLGMGRGTSFPSGGFLSKFCFDTSDTVVISCVFIYFFCFIFFPSHSFICYLFSFSIYQRKSEVLILNGFISPVKTKSRK